MRQQLKSRQRGISFFSLIMGMIVLALLSFWRPLRRAHLAILAVALWLIGFAYLSAGYPPAPALQNDLVLGLLLLMVALVPSQADLPPESWRPLLAREPHEGR